MGLFWKKDRSVIRVRLFNVDTGAVFAELDMQVQQLPESFEADTTLHLQDGDWQVIEARPMTAAEFRSTCELVLVLRKIQAMNASS